MLKMLSKIFFGERVAYLLFFLKPGAPTPAELEGDEGELFSRSNPYHCRLHCAKLDDRFHETHHIGANLKSFVEHYATTASAAHAPTRNMIRTKEAPD